MIKILLCAVLISLSYAAPVRAQENESAASTIDILPAKSIAGTPDVIQDEDTTHPPLRLTPDKSELVRLSDDAATILVGNPVHLSVLAESSKLLVFIPRQLGATYVTILNQAGEIIMQRHVIIGSGKEKYIRIRKSCAGSDDKNCQQTQVYYCPDMCHAIAPASTEEAKASEEEPDKPNNFDQSSSSDAENETPQ